MNDQTRKPFRVVVVGGGVTGLAASHALQKANIDHVVLERSGNAAPSLGTSIAIYPHGCRLLEQFGCLEACEATTAPYKRMVNRMPDGRIVANNDLWKVVRENHGFDFLLMERRCFLEVLYESLPDKSKILMNKGVKDIQEDQDGVEVFCQDGTSERGDMVIGCDGVHSKVREIMWEKAARLAPGLITANEKKTMTTTWNCLLGMGPGEPELDHEVGAVHNDRYSFLVSAQPDKTYWFVFMRVDKPYSTYKRPRYTEKDAEDAAASMAEHPVSGTKVFGELWRNRWRSVMVDIEEGVLNHWHFGRSVLVGDAAHKITPNIALGGNTGMESMAALTNLLNREVKSHPEGKPNKETLDVIFQEYQERQIPRTQKIMKFANLVTRVQAWDGFWMKLMALWVVPFQSDKKLGQDLGDIIKGGVKLDFVPIREYKEKNILWDDEKQPEEETSKKKTWDLVKQQHVPLLGLFVALSSALWLMGRNALPLFQ